MEFHDKLTDSHEDGGDCPKQDKSHPHPREYTVLMADENMAPTTVTVEQPVPSGRQILVAAGCTPPEDYALIQLLRPGTRLVGLEDTVALLERETNVFRAFRGGDVHLFTIDGHGYEWGASEISELILLYLAAIPEDKILVLKVDDKEIQVRKDEPIRLSRTGVEHLHTRPKMVTVKLDGEEKTIPTGIYTTEELIQALSVEPGYLLNVMKGDQLITLRPNEKLHVKGGMLFISQVPGGASS